MKRKMFMALLICVMTLTAAWADVGDYVLKDGKVYRVDGGKEKLLEDEEPQRAGTEAGLFSWILVDSELSEEMKGSKPGIYFFLGDDEKPFGFLPFKNAAACMLEFSLSGEKLLVSCGEEVKQDLSLYFIDLEKKSFEKKASFNSAGHCFWVDPHRFIFTSIDVEKGPRTKGGDDWQCSPALYDTEFEELTILKKATDTVDYIIIGCDHDEGTLDINESSVKDMKDWSDSDKIEYKEMTIPIPAAG
ncbi:MAG: hypothetical protein K6E38_03165 [Fretibacterium sp.]|nr:hypothetical protein [Fretibacterium sp.]